MNGSARLLPLLLGALLLAGACGTPSTPAPPTPTTGSTTPAATAPAATGSSAGSLITVPDVSGMNHQDAQNAMQAAGLYNLREVDGKGEGRALVVDRNWVQTGQSPAPGTQVTPDTVITLTAVKYTD
ncbi:PASTA domain-containing protein [Amycolatopsis magusensis]|uniref:PASTA domain-containing protein n=1 Tax=Amycolatopsis magusensis TaxID=882444 RepID=UPI0024A88E9E|nr:PASTA domain-containing protein [Amycolatopsis magusensis]MDI5981878.1 PASTA domain-containing protein [Amycolatopsis magusensis]